MPVSPPEPAGRFRHANAIMAIASLLMSLVVLAHAGLIGRSRWQADEYQHFASLRDNGLGFALGRFLEWGPRPWSEALGTVYGLVVNRVHRPLAGSCIALLWVGLGLACLLPAWHQEARERWPRLLMGLTIFALFLLGHPVTEVFFWPAGGLAYLPTLAAAMWLFWCLEDGITRRSRAWSAAAALILAAGSSEVGLFLSVFFAGCVALRPGGVPRTRLWWLLPGVGLAVPLVILLLHGRVGHEQAHGVLGSAMTHAASSAPADSGPVFHHAAASLRAAIPDFLGEAIGIDDDVDGTAPSLKIFVALASFLGARWTLPGRGRDGAGQFLPHLACALLLAAFCTIAAADYQFGKLCCQRHQTMRECFFVLSYISLGAASARWHKPSRNTPARSAACLVLPVMLLFAARIPALLSTYRSYPQAVEARAETWHTGLQTGTGEMTLVLEPDGGLISSGRFLAPGTYVLGGDSSWYLQGFLGFFQKRRLHVR